MKALREPLLHFLIAGAALFGAYQWLGRSAERPDQNPTQQIHVRAGDVQWIAENWTKQWRRVPTREELQGLVVDYVNEQLLAREARALRLDENDVIIRRWLAQKITFLIEGTVRQSEPSEAELLEFYENQVGRFRKASRISFEHIYFSTLRRADAQADAMRTLAELLKNDSVPTEEFGDPSLLDPQLENVTEHSVASQFGADFAEAVFSLKPATWNGPIQSSYGLHLVRVGVMTPASPPTLAEARAGVLEAWLQDREKLLKKQYLADLRKKYTVVADEAVVTLLSGPIARTASSD